MSKWINHPTSNAWEIHTENGDGYIRAKDEGFYWKTFDVEAKSISQIFEPLPTLEAAKQQVENLLGINND